MNPVFEQLQNEIARSLEGLSADQTQLRPARLPDDGDKWTIQQIVQHLCLTYSSTDTTIASRLEKGRPTQAVPTIQQRCAQLFVTKFRYFPYGRKAPSVVVPPEAPASPRDQIAGAELSDETARRLAHTDKILESACSLFGGKRAASHGVLGPLSVEQWRRFHLAHGLHHVKQIWAIRHQHHV